MGINRDLNFEDLESMPGRSGQAFKKTKAAGKKGNKGGGSKSVLDGGKPRKQYDLCWGTKCDQPANRIAGIANTDPKTSKSEPTVLVPLCQSCAGKVKRRAAQRGLPTPEVSAMNRHESEQYRLYSNAASSSGIGVDQSTGEMKQSLEQHFVDKMISSKRAGSTDIYGYGEGNKLGHQVNNRRWNDKSMKDRHAGNPKNGHTIHSQIASLRQRKEAALLFNRVLKGEFQSLSDNQDKK